MADAPKTAEAKEAPKNAAPEVPPVVDLEAQMEVMRGKVADRLADVRLGEETAVKTFHAGTHKMVDRLGRDTRTSTIGIITDAKRRMAAIEIKADEELTKFIEQWSN